MTNMEYGLGIVFCLFVWSCGNPSAEQVASPEIISDSTNALDTTTITYANTQDLFPDKVEIKHAKHFTVSYHGNYKVVKTDATFFPNGKEAAGEDRSDIMLLVQKGTEVPATEGPLAGATIITIPTKEVAVNVQHSESFLRELGLEDYITTIGGTYSYNEKMRNKALNHEIGQIGYSWHSPPNLEVLLERKPSLFLMTIASMSYAENLNKSRRIGIPTATVFDWAEQDYLARAEWVKFYALFFNAEAKANMVFQQISDRIEELKALTVSLPQQSVIWGYYTNKSQWEMQISGFQAQYMRDANLNNILFGNVEPNANGNQVLSSEQLLAMGKDASHWIIGDIHASPLPNESIMSSFQAWNSGMLYHNMKRVDPKSNSSDWYATAIVRPDSVLADLIKLVHPELLPDYEPVFMDTYDKERQLN